MQVPYEVSYYAIPMSQVMGQHSADCRSINTDLVLVLFQLKMKNIHYVSHPSLYTGYVYSCMTRMETTETKSTQLHQITKFT